MGRYTATEPRMLEDGRVMLRVPRLKLRMVLKVELEKLRGMGVEPTDEEIVWLYELAKERVFPGADRPPAFLMPPIVLGAETNVPLAFWEPTVAALAWLEEYASVWWEDNDLRPLAYAYVMSNPNQPHAFSDLVVKHTALKTVNGWFRKLPYTASLIDWACAQIQELPDGYADCQLPNECMKPEATTNPLEWGDIIATLSAANGIPPEHYARMNKSMLVAIWNNLDNTPLAQMMSGETGRDRSGGGAMLAMHAAMRHIAAEHGVDYDANESKDKES